ncbi:MAG TPA: hypothetical protein VJR92_15900 [Gemmatimonadaceae bacterium]|nr:hypothetical protein [Gemmatimonadaceae bacterium]
MNSRIGWLKQSLFVGVAMAVAWSRSFGQITLVDRCDSCSVRFRQVVRLGEADGDASFANLPHAVHVDARGRFWIAAGAEPPRVFSAEGAFLKRIGTPGAGPGEFRFPRSFFSVPAESVVVLDVELSRANVITPDLRFARSIQLPAPLFPALAVEWPARVVLQGQFRASASAGWPLHRFSFADGTAAATSSFGPDSGELRPGADRRLAQVFARSTGSTYWCAEVYRFRIIRRDRDDKALQVIERTPSWFENSRPGLGNPRNPPPPAITAIAQDRDGLLWIFARIPSLNWSQAWASIPPGATEIPAGRIDVEKLYRTAVIIIEPGTGRTVAERILDVWTIEALGDRRAAVLSTNDSGVPHVTILAFDLANRR